MSDRRYLKDAEREHGQPLDTLIPALLASEGTIYGVAVKLGVYPNSVRNWMKTNGVRLETRRVVVQGDEAQHG